MKNKKTILIIIAALIVVAVLILVWCLWGKDISSKVVGENLITCSMSNDYPNEAKVEYEYVIHSNKKKNIVNKVVITQVIESDDKEILDYYEKEFNKQYEAADEKYGGIDFEVNRDSKKVSLDLTIDYRDVDMDKFIKENENFKDYLNKDNEIKTDDLKAFYEKTGFGCSNNK